MNYKEALEMNESKTGLDFRGMELSDLLALIDEIPGWDYPLAEEAMAELARRAEIDINGFFEESDGDYSDLWAAATEKLKEENKMYTVKSEFIDQWFGSASTDEIEKAQAKGFTAEDISRLARDWGVSAEDLMEQVEEM